MRRTLLHKVLSTLLDSPLLKPAVMLKLQRLFYENKTLLHFQPSGSNIAEVCCHANKEGPSLPECQIIECSQMLFLSSTHTKCVFSFTFEIWKSIFKLFLQNRKKKKKDRLFLSSQRPFIFSRSSF